MSEHILPALGSRPLVEVTPAEIAGLLEQVTAGAAPARARQVRATLRELSADAVDDGIIVRDPIRAAASCL